MAKNVAKYNILDEPIITNLYLHNQKLNILNFGTVDIHNSNFQKHKSAETKRTLTQIHQPDSDSTTKISTTMYVDGDRKNFKACTANYIVFTYRMVGEAALEAP